MMKLLFKLYGWRVFKGTRFRKWLEAFADKYNYELLYVSTTLNAEMIIEQINYAFFQPALIALSRKAFRFQAKPIYGFMETEDYPPDPTQKQHTLYVWVKHDSEKRIENRENSGQGAGRNEPEQGVELREDYAPTDGACCHGRCSQPEAE